MRVVVPGAAAIAAVTLVGCQVPQWGSPFSPTATPSASGSVEPSASGASAPTPSSSAPVPTHKATGTLVFYQMAVSTKMAGTCVGTEPVTAVLSDHANDFYTTVDLTAVFDPVEGTVSSVTGDLGEDTEGFTRKLSYSGAAPAAGTSATLTGKGPTYQIAGVLTSQETRHSKTTTTRTLPFTLKVTCKTS